MPALPEPAAGSGPPGHVRDPCNAGLQQRIEAWRRHGVSLRCTDQTNGLKAVRDAAVPEPAGYGFSAGQQVLHRLEAGSAGGSAVLVDPRGTSRRCSGCGAEPDRPKTLGDRVHGCDGCGLGLDRDVNAARNVLQLVQGPGEPAFGREACGLPRSLAESRRLRATEWSLVRICCSRWV